MKVKQLQRHSLELTKKEKDKLEWARAIIRSIAIMEPKLILVENCNENEDIYNISDDDICLVLRVLDSFIDGGELTMTEAYGWDLTIDNVNLEFEFEYEKM